jgi:hypothetical protein
MSTAAQNGLEGSAAKATRPVEVANRPRKLSSVTKLKISSSQIRNVRLP